MTDYLMPCNLITDYIMYLQVLLAPSRSTQEMTVKGKKWRQSAMLEWVQFREFADSTVLALCAHPERTTRERHARFRYSDGSSSLSW